MKNEKQTNQRKAVIIIINIVIVYFFSRIAEVYCRSPGDIFQRLASALRNVQRVITPPFFSFSLGNLLFGIGVVGFIWLYLSTKIGKKKFRKGIEYGSARWGEEKDIKPFMDKTFSNNIILSETEGLTMRGRMQDPKLNRNKNVLIVGGSGSGKTRFFGKPNLMQLHSSYVYTDPKGSVLEECGSMFLQAGYELKILNTINFKKSMHYNPFSYIRCEADIIRFATALIMNTTRKGAVSSDPFWEEAEKLLYSALIGYIYYEGMEEEKNIVTLMIMLDAIETRENNENFKSAVDLLFDELEEKNKERERTGRKEEAHWFPVRQWKKFKNAAGKTAKSILICAGSRMAPFDIDEVRELMKTDEMELDLLGDRKTALFIIISDTDPTFNFISALLYTQMFNLLCTKADDVYGGRLPIHVRCILDEFANIGQIPNFEHLIASIRSREISASIILQAMSQLKAVYKDNAETIAGNCDTKIFLGGTEKTTLKDMEETLGTETVDLFNESEQRSREKTTGINYNKIGRKLMSVDEINVMPRDKCIVQVSGLRPFYSNKYDITKHPNYHYLSDFDKKNKLNIEAYVTKTRKSKLRFQSELELAESRTGAIV